MLVLILTRKNVHWKKNTWASRRHDHILVWLISRFFCLRKNIIEYGGTGGPIAEMKKYWTELFMKNRFVELPTVKFYCTLEHISLSKWISLFHEHELAGTTLITTAIGWSSIRPTNWTTMMNTMRRWIEPNDFLVRCNLEEFRYMRHEGDLEWRERYREVTWFGTIFEWS